MARIVRGSVLSIKEQEYVLAARTVGASPWRIMARHLIPNAMGSIIVALAMNIPSAIFTESFLSFIGLGVSAPMASWGTLANDALGDGLRDALDPRLRK
jgi:oligopeptide transport system permease protein